MLAKKIKAAEIWKCDATHFALR